MSKIIIGPEVEALWAKLEREGNARAERLPDERACLNAAMEAYIRLETLGWRDIMYCPKDGTHFDSIGAGSAGIHETWYHGEWPNGSWWLWDGGDTWPAHPTMFRLKQPTTDQDATRTSSPKGEHPIL